jgi:S1-C subfamily serine protease
VTALDWIIVAFTLLMAVWGYMQGLVVGAMSLGGFITGALIGSRLGPLLLSGGSHSPYAPLFTLVGAVVVGGILASVLEALGFQLRRRMGTRLGQLDGAAGSVLVACFGLGLVWIAGAVALQTPGARHLRRDIQRSAILQALNDALPPSGALLNALARFDPLPSINGPEANVPAPTSRIARDPDVAAAGRSVVRILGTACGLGVQGSGWIAGNGIVVTNAHVVAGEDDTTVQLRGIGPHYRATAIWFDARNDVAVLRADAIGGATSLRLRIDTPVGTSAAVLGFPLNGPYDVEPARLGQTEDVLTQDAYGRGPVRRSITALRGLVRSGNSGGPVVDGQGRVVTTVFAATVGGTRRSGFGVPASIVASALRQARGPVDTGGCAG